MKRLFFFFFLIPTLFFSCKSNSLYEDYRAIKASGWEQDSVAVFKFDVEKNYLNYSLSINVRNRGDYQFSNLWLFVDITSPGNVTVSDTIEYQLSYPDGRWTGKGTGGIFSNQFLFRDNVFFPIPGNYTVSIKHAMRPNPLVGICDIGICVKRKQP